MIIGVIDTLFIGDPQIFCWKHLRKEKNLIIIIETYLQRFNVTLFKSNYLNFSYLFYEFPFLLSYEISTKIS